MDYSVDHLAQSMRQANVRPSGTRLHVLRYLREKRNHPTADQIYQALRGELPTLSRTSVYNTLSTFAQAGLVRPVPLEGSEMRYDAFMPDHGHFRCERCGAIHDFDMDAGGAPLHGLEGYEIHRTDLFVWGLCPGCAPLPDNE